MSREKKNVDDEQGFGVWSSDFCYVMRLAFWLVKIADFLTLGHSWQFYWPIFSKSSESSSLISLSALKYKMWPDLVLRSQKQRLFWSKIKPQSWTLELRQNVLSYFPFLFFVKSRFYLLSYVPSKQWHMSTTRLVDYEDVSKYYIRISGS